MVFGIYSPLVWNNSAKLAPCLRLWWGWEWVWSPDTQGRAFRVMISSIMRSGDIGTCGPDAPGARHTRPIETNQAAASSPGPRRAARHPWFRADPIMSAETTAANLPYGTATALSRRVTGPPPAMRAARPLNCPLRGAHRKVCPRRELRPARAAVRPRGPADGPCASPPRRRPNPRVATPSADRERARCRAGRALPALRRADGASMGRMRPLLRTGDQGNGGLRRPLFAQCEERHHGGLPGPPPHTRIILYYSRPPGSPASPGTPCGEPRRAVGANHPFVGEWRAMLLCHIMVCDHSTHPTCTAPFHYHRPHPWYTHGRRPGSSPGRCHTCPLRPRPTGCGWRGLILRSGLCLSAGWVGAVAASYLGRA